MQMRTLGKTGISLSVIGFGAIVFVNEEKQFAFNAVSRAIDEGVNYFDMGPRYGNGEAEQKGGPAIQPYRHKIFLAEKTAKRTKDEAAIELRNSLTAMKTDYFDLYQFHAVKTIEEVQTIVGPNGALEAFVEARNQGLIRYIGFSAHSQEAAFALIDSFKFDTILFPVNYVTWHEGSFGPLVIEKASNENMGILALKALGKKARDTENRDHWPKAWYSPVDTYQEAKTALSWTLSQPVTSCVSPGHAELLWWMIDAEKEITKLSDKDKNLVKQSAQGITPFFTA